VAEDIFSGGCGHAIIARKLPDGRIAVGFFLLDVFCLGVKNAFFTVASPEEFEEILADRFRQPRLESVSPAYARKLVEGAIAYARDLGFEPHRDIRDASVVLGDIDPNACTETFTFGKDGKPFYISGPYESQARIRHVIAQLRRRCGPDGAHFIVRADDPSLRDTLGPDQKLLRELCRELLRFPQTISRTLSRTTSASQARIETPIRHNMRAHGAKVGYSGHVEVELQNALEEYMCKNRIAGA
jgi:hypothetical protein